MPLLFVYLCDLFDTLEYPHLREVPFLPAHSERYVRDKTVEWLKRHARRINASDTDVMLMLHPEDQTDRIYGLEPQDLELIIARALSLSRDQYADLQKWQTAPSSEGLSFRVKRVIDNLKRWKQPVRAETNSATVDEIDQCLLRIAAFNSASSNAVKSLAPKWQHGDHVKLLGGLYSRLNGREAKWLTRLILKDLSPVKFPENLGLGANISQLPNCLSVSIQFTPSSSAVRRDGTGMILGSGTTLPPNRHLPKTFAALPTSLSAPGILSAASPQAMVPLIPTVSSASVAPITSRDPFPTSSTPRPVSRSQKSTSPKPSASKSKQPSNFPRKVLGQISSDSQTLTSRIRTSPNADSPLFKAGTGRCRLGTNPCPLQDYLFLLSPCLLRQTLHLKTLLSFHGCHYLLSLTSLKHPSLSLRNRATKKKFRKGILVDTYRKKETIDFLKQISDLDLKTDGKKEWVQVYDWRILDLFRKEEEGKEMGYDIWKRCWMCAV